MGKFKSALSRLWRSFGLNVIIPVAVYYGTVIALYIFLTTIGVPFLYTLALAAFVMLVILELYFRADVF